MKKVSFLICMILILPTIVLASDNEIKEVSSESGLKDCINTENLCKLSGDISLQDVLNVTEDVVIDLSGHAIVPSSEFTKKGGFVVVERGAKLTINDSKGNGKISTGTKENSNVWGAIQIGKDTTGSEVAELEINGGTIEGYYYGVVGNGTVHNTKITVNGGTIAGLNADDSVGIYNPQLGDVTINGGQIRGGTGIEMRSGTLIVNDGDIEGIAPKFVKVVTGNGSTTNGVGITVAQHTTKNPIKVTINDGDISGEYAFYEWNPHKNEKADLDKISLQINGGNFVGNADGVSTVYSEDFTNFISGGKFNKSVSKYLTDDAKVASKTVDGDNMDDEFEAKSNKGCFLISILFVLAVCGGVFVAYKKVH